MGNSMYDKNEIEDSLEFCRQIKEYEDISATDKGTANESQDKSLSVMAEEMETQSHSWDHILQEQDPVSVDFDAVKPFIAPPEPETSAKAMGGLLEKEEEAKSSVNRRDRRRLRELRQPKRQTKKLFGLRQNRKERRQKKRPDLRQNRKKRRQKKLPDFRQNRKERRQKKQPDLRRNRKERRQKKRPDLRQNRKERQQKKRPDLRQNRKERRQKKQPDLRQNRKERQQKKLL